MLDLTRTQGNFQPIEMALDPTVTPSESGLAYVRTKDAMGMEVIKPSTGAAGEKFVGVAYMDKHAAAQGVRIEYPARVPAAAPYTVALPDVNVVGATLKVVDAAGNVVAPASVTGNLLTFAAGDANKDLKLSYNYTLSAQQKQLLGISPIASSSEFISKIAVLAGYVRCWVTNFDASAAWDINADVTLGANGMFTMGGAVKAAECIQIPTAADPFLGIEYTTGR
jgi:hypothetical protein